MTDKQASCIDYIESVLDIKFTGSTFEEVSNFIGENLPKAKQEEEEFKEYMSNKWRW